jgi:hypothetical protein
MGYCDRFAAGLPEEMSIYFDPLALFKTVEYMLVTSVNITSNKVLNGHRDHIRDFGECGSEMMLMLWLSQINHIQQAEITQPLSLSFITLRTAQGNKYCNMSRSEVNRYPGT